MTHTLQKRGKSWYCSVCHWEWTSKPSSSCPGVPRYSWATKPDNLHTKTSLGRIGLKLAPNQRKCGIVQSGDGKEWWELYDAHVAVPKQKKSPPSKSTRAPCPIDLDCLLIAAERGKPCPNKDYCSSLVRPWTLPYECSVLSDGTKCLKVNYRHSAGWQEKEAAGYAEAINLPYAFIESDLGKPILVVYSSRNYQQEAGWYAPSGLESNYRLWAAGRSGATYEEFKKVEESNRDWWQHWCYPSSWQFYEREIPNYPHCILPSW